MVDLSIRGNRNYGWQDDQGYATKFFSSNPISIWNSMTGTNCYISSQTIRHRTASTINGAFTLSPIYSGYRYVVGATATAGAPIALPAAQNGIEFEMLGAAALAYQFSLSAGTTPIYMPNGSYATSIANFILPNEALRIWSDGTDWYVEHLSGPKAAVYYGVVAVIAPSTGTYTYTFPGPGKVHIHGGTVSAVSYVRGVTVLPYGYNSTGMEISGGTGDQIEVTNTAVPNMYFVPM